MVDSNPSVLRLGGGQILLRGRALVAVRRLADAGLRAGRRDGIAPTAGLVALLAELAAEADTVEMSLNGHADIESVRLRPVSAECDPVWMTAGEACVALGMSPRQARRLAPQLNGRKVGRSWLLDRAQVEALAAERAAA